jgi:heterodisulfide reductase subunit A
MKKRVIVIGGGIAGLVASLSAAELGKNVLLIEKSSSIGGMLERLDTWFIDDACGMCQVLPQLASDDKLDRCLRRDFFHPLIEIKTLTEVKSVEESDEGTKVILRRLPRYVDEIKCTSCRLCEEVCPEEGPDPFNKGFSQHKAIHTLYAGSLTKTYYIDKNICTECGKCVEVCPTKAIDLTQKEKEETVLASSIIITAGFSEIDPTSLKSFGYGKFKNVLTSLDFERYISRSGSHPDEITRPSDEKKPKSIAIIQCVGSRDKEREYCSSACCMYAVKEGRKIREISKGIDVSIFYMDLRAFGKGHYQYVLDAEKMGVQFKNFRIPSLVEDGDGNLIVSYEEEGKMKEETFDLVILSTGQEISEENKKMLDLFGVSLDQYGFISSEGLEAYRTSKENIYIAGSVSEPKDIETGVIEARSAGFLCESQKEEEKEAFQPLDLDYRIPRFGIFLCQCGGVIQKTLDVSKVKKEFEDKEDIPVVEEVDLVCQEKRLDSIMEKAKEKGLTRLLFATCSPAKYEILIRNAAKRYGFDQNMIDILSLREHIAWAYDHGGEDVAIQRIKALIESLRMAVPDELQFGKGTSSAVIIGGGISGVVAGKNLSRNSVKVHIIEKSKTLGGHGNDLSKTLEGDDVQKYVTSLTKEVTDDPNIEVHFESELSSVSGTAGQFTVEVEKGDEKQSIGAGAIIVATGAKEYVPKEYEFGKDEKIVTQVQFENLLFDRSFDLGHLSSVVMIQCVGSRNDDHPWCSKVCCSDALKNALELREKSKDVNITILYRDMMSYGKKELKFKEAREKGINFIRFKKDEEPVVSLTGKKIEVRTKDQVLGKDLKFEPDMLVLSTGIVPYDNKKLCEILGVTLDKNGFFKGANPKFRPHESEKSGIFFAGLCRSPSGIKDAISEATAAAGNAYMFLRDTSLIQRRTISEVIERWCAGCEFCVEACPFDARSLDEEKKIVKVHVLNCVGCGNCVSVCPSGASKLRGIKDKQMIGMIDVST